LSLSQTILGNFGDSNLSGGLAFSMDHTMYYGNVSEDAAPRIQAQDYMRDDLSLSVVPFLEYSLNDTLSLRTVFAYFNYLHFKNEFGNPTEFVRSEPYQSVGLGISVTRDIYLYPNVQFVPRDVRADRTNVGLSANINLF
jgi:hypothetical protein